MAISKNKLTLLKFPQKIDPLVCKVMDYKKVSLMNRRNVTSLKIESDQGGFCC
jgi:translation initiation factor IF-3